MSWRALLFAVLATSFINQAVLCQEQPPSSAEAKRIEALVNKAAAVVDAKGKAALAEFREHGSEWWSGPMAPCSLIPLSQPARGVRTMVRKTRRARRFTTKL
jgi:hypothetical protein